MNREEFTAFVARTLEDVIQLAEKQCGKQLSRKLAFQWLGRSQPLVTEGVVEHIVDRVFLDEEHIYPCVDIGVGDVLDGGTLLIIANIAGYAPKPFGKNWKGKDGPFIHIIGGPFLTKMAGNEDNWAPDKPFGFITPGLSKPD